MANEIVPQDKIEKLARMEAAGIPHKQIALATNLSESRISQIFATNEFKIAVEKVAVENFEEQELINQGWDGVEALGITKVVSALQNDPDPDFALRAAAVANKAARRGNYRNNPIAQQAGVRTIINLNNTFIEKLQANTEIGADKVKTLINEKKSSDFMNPAEVQKMLKIESKKENESDKLPDLSFMPLG